jgi:ATP/ADP translocase
MTPQTQRRSLLSGMRIDSPMIPAIFGATALMASQIAAKATRDAFFLSKFGVTALPIIVIAAALVSIVASVVSARLNRSLLPTRVLPHIFTASSVLLLAGWWISTWNSALAAVLIYLEITVLGSMLISAFWSLLDDQFDPRSAKEQFGKIVAAGTLGGVIGGLLAARVGSSVGVTIMLPGLAALHLLCAVVAGKLLSNRQRAIAKYSALSKASTDSGLNVVRTVPYVRDLARLILTSTMGAVLLDYVFKARAAETYSGGQELVSFFALFYTMVGVATFLVQLVLSRVVVDRLGVAGTVSSLPVSLTLGSIGAIVLPGLAPAFAMRGGEAMVRSSLFKSSYEMLYAAIPRRERQATKSLLDVGVERLGDLLGALLLGGISWLVVSEPAPVVLGAAAFLGVSGFVVSRRLRRGYVQALENNLLNRARAAGLSESSSLRARGLDTTRSMTIGLAVNPQRVLPGSDLAESDAAGDPVIRQIHGLRSSDPGTVRSVLIEPMDAALAPSVIALLAWDEVAAEATDALRRMGPKITGQLVDVLLDSEEEFAVRRRVPRVLGRFDTQRAVDGLIEGLSADRFEVRFRSAQALSTIKMRKPNVVIDADNITKAVQRELETEPEFKSNPRIRSTRPEPKGFVTMDHVFRLLALIYPCEPLWAAHRGLESQDDHLRRTSLEYLENVLPAPVWQRIVPMFEDVSLAIAG